MKHGRWVTNNIGRLVKQEAAKMRKMPRPPISEDEQLDRFMRGAERWRLDAGLITPDQWQEYQATMLRRLEG